MIRSLLERALNVNGRHLVIGLLLSLVVLFAASVGLQLLIYIQLARLQQWPTSDPGSQQQPIPVIVKGRVDADVRNWPLDVRLHDHSIGGFQPIPVEITNRSIGVELSDEPLGVDVQNSSLKVELRDHSISPFDPIPVQASR